MTKEEMDKLDVWLGENITDDGPMEGYTWYKPDWHPTTNDGQAIKCAEKTGLPYHINKIGVSSYFCEVGNSNSFAYENTLSLAVSLACKKAWGGK